LNETCLDLTRGQHKKSFYATCGGKPIVFSEVKVKKNEKGVKDRRRKKKEKSGPGN